MSSAPGDPLVSVDSLRRVFSRGRGEVTEALADVSFEVRANEILGVVGPNGAGKTTLLDVLATTVTPTGGTARICGFDIRRQAGAVRRVIGYVPAGARAMYPRLTVHQNLAFFAALYGICGAAADSRIEAALRLVDAGDVARVRVDRVSDGMIARAALARALLHDPAVLLLDEPARSLDPLHRPTILRGIRRLVKEHGKAAVLVTHAVEDLFEVCDRVAVLRGGRLVSTTPVTRARDQEAISRAMDVGVRT